MTAHVAGLTLRAAQGVGAHAARQRQLLLPALQPVKTSMVTAPIAVETRGGFLRVDHEAQAGAAGGHQGGFVGAGAAGGGVGHLFGGREC